MIKNDLWESEVESAVKAYESDMTNKITMDLNYQVTLNSNDLLSVVYLGTSYIEGGAYPTSEIYAMTINLNSTTKLKLSDVTTIDKNLVERIKKSTAVTNAVI